MTVICLRAVRPHLPELWAGKGSPGDTLNVPLAEGQLRWAGDPWGAQQLGVRAAGCLGSRKDKIPSLSVWEELFHRLPGLGAKTKLLSVSKWRQLELAVTDPLHCDRLVSPAKRARQGTRSFQAWEPETPHSPHPSCQLTHTLAWEKGQESYRSLLIRAKGGEFQAI